MDVFVVQVWRGLQPPSGNEQVACVTSQNGLRSTSVQLPLRTIFLAVCMHTLHSYKGFVVVVCPLNSFAPPQFEN